MKYFIDTEFIEGFYKPLFGKRRHFIDLISIGIVAEDGREYYAISKDFDLKSSWNKYDIIPATPTEPKEKIYWLRENVLKPIFNDFRYKFNPAQHDIFDINTNKFTYNNFKLLLAAYGKSNNQIADEIYEFVCSYPLAADYAGVESITKGAETYLQQNPPEFYGYYADYDWVLFCSLFGRMIDLPKGFPWYCIDLKQMLDDFAMSDQGQMLSCVGEPFMEQYDDFNKVPLELALKQIKKQTLKKYPQQTNEHNALSDAKWNKQLYNFLTNL